MPNRLNIEKLRREARDLKKAKGIQHAKALDMVASHHGFTKWTDLVAAQNGDERSERRTRSPYTLRRSGRTDLDEQPPEGAHLSPYENPTMVKQIFRS